MPGALASTERTCQQHALRDSHTLSLPFPSLSWLGTGRTPLGAMRCAVLSCVRTVLPGSLQTPCMTPAAAGSVLSDCRLSPSSACRDNGGREAVPGPSDAEVHQKPVHAGHIRRHPPTPTVRAPIPTATFPHHVQLPQVPVSEGLRDY